MRRREEPIAPPNLHHYTDTPLFNTKAVVQETGVPAPTLRAWERRYGILSPERGSNAYRLYSKRDIATVRWLKNRVEAGMTISQAIALLRTLEQPATTGGVLPTPALHEAGAVGETAAPPLRETLNPTHLSSELVRAFQDLDEARAQQLLAIAFAVYSVEDVCLHLITPTMYQVGELWARGELPAAIEHFASNVVRTQLSNLFHASPAIREGPLVLIGCAPGEAHELGALMLAVFLRRAGIRVAYMGQDAETTGLVRLVEQWRPALLALSASVPSALPGLTEVARAIAALPPPRPQFGFGGRIFVLDPALIARVPGSYLGDHAGIVVPQVKGLLKQE
jgi:DNA-binding transcriptional MerR regulator